MTHKVTIAVCMFCLIVLPNASAQTMKTDSSQKKQVVLPNQKQEVTAIYKECLDQKHGAMMNCVQQKVMDLQEDVEILQYVPKSVKENDWQGPDDYNKRKNTLPLNEENLQRGENVYQFYCSGCHGKDGRGQDAELSFGKKAADLTSAKLLNKPDGAILWKITEGGWPMPAFWEGDVLNENDFWALIHYIRSMSEKQ